MFKDYLLVTDLDGTLLDSQKKISAENKAAIDEFINGGGIFTIATGRGYNMALPIMQMLKVNAPAIIFNGCAIFDFNKEEYLWQEFLKKDSREYVKKLLSVFPKIGCEVLSGKNVYVPALNEVEKWHLGLADIDGVFCEVDDTPEDWFKVLFAEKPENIQPIIDYVKENPYQNGDFTRSADVFYELIPKGINKGYGLKKLVDILNIKDRKIIVAGDYNNDIEMMKVADISFAMGNAVDEVKDIAHHIVSDNNSNGVAEIIDYLKSLNKL